MSENETPETVEETATDTQAETTEEVKAEETETVEAAAETPAEPEAPAEPEEISYHAVEKEGEITAIWEMQGKKHVRTISARSGEGQKILSLFTSEIHETDSPGMASAAAPEAKA